MTPYSRLAGVYDEIVVDPCFSDWAQFLVDLWSGDHVSSVLDVCCGTGLLADELVQRGVAVVGVDASPEMLDRAHRLLGDRANLVAATLPDLPVSGPFDAAVSTMDGLNYLTPPDFRSSLAAIADRLRPGGWLVFDLHTDAMLDYIATHPTIEGEERGLRFVISTEADLGARTCDSTISVRDDNGQHTFAETHRQYFHSDSTVRSSLQDAGFALVATYDEYSLVPAGAATMRATWVARRPEFPS